MSRTWEASSTAEFRRRLGKSAVELGDSKDGEDCPDIWELSNGDVAVIGRDMTANYSARLPLGVTIRHDERLVVVPRRMLIAAKPDLPDA